MPKSRSQPKEWRAISSADGTRHGYYEVSGGVLTVRNATGRTKTTTASSAALPAKFGYEADRSLAALMLTEEF